MFRAIRYTAYGMVKIRSTLSLFLSDLIERDTERQAWEALQAAEAAAQQAHSAQYHAAREAAKQPVTVQMCAVQFFDHDTQRRFTWTFEPHKNETIEQQIVKFMRGQNILYCGRHDYTVTK